MPGWRLPLARGDHSSADRLAPGPGR